MATAQAAAEPGRRLEIRPGAIVIGPGPDDEIGRIERVVVSACVTCQASSRSKNS
jgi:hypothetical protein